ncbi:patatin-like phospholipase family protein [Salipiger sp. P9]|uniref:patatin-like phospholipase family protein n=1 Tax=Salipiger pentaromativorans TaxID=2943193 RepID=UPI0021584CB1|nr:patatin-like phospholipase family protein [Salipiger pentaromativorans]MCR8547435.1 patatin-like phospholipase family protein [Salipiger pentaromativorans]
MTWNVSQERAFFPEDSLASYNPDALGLAISGGGYRATLFHAGALIRMNELKFLPRIDRISSVSGGSITAGILAMGWKHFDFDDDGRVTAASFQKHFIDPILAATARTIDVGVTVAGYMPFVSAGNVLARNYDKHIFKGMMLSDLPERPAFVFNATNLQTGGLFRFTRNYAADWRALTSTVKTIRVADAVAASSAFPPVLAPVRLDLSGEEVSTPDRARYNDPRLHKKPVLVDAGVYDNLGLESVWKRCGAIICSYAGHNAKPNTGNFNLGHMVTVVNTFLAGSIDWRERTLISLFTSKLSDGLPERRGAYWSAGSTLENYPVHDGWKPDAQTIEAAKLTSTRLKGLSRDAQKQIIYAGYGFADAGLRSYLPDGGTPPEGPPL